MKTSILPNIFFNAQHAPIGAFSSFTLGFPGRSGGLGMELGRPANQDVYIGLETNEPNVFEAFPFFEGFKDPNQDFGLLAASKARAHIKIFMLDKIERHYSVSSDVWRAGDLTVAIYNPVHSIPDPQDGDTEELKKVLLPAVLVEITVDNRCCPNPRKVFLGFRGNDPYYAMRRLDETSDGRLIGIAQGNRYAIATWDQKSYSGLGFNIEDILNPVDPVNLNFGVGSVGAIVAVAKPHSISTFRCTVCFYHSGIATAGWEGKYYYTRFFDSIEKVAEYGLRYFETYQQWALEANQKINIPALSPEQKFMLAHSIRSYYASTQLLDIDNKPVWVVNEGEYRMINTLDLTADHLFFEMTMNPWTVRNVLDNYYERYSYRDCVRSFSSGEEHPGGLSFTHDMGIGNVFWKRGFSCYEQAGLTGCFSYMTCEELVNWTCCATVYGLRTRDQKWLNSRLSVFEECLHSLVVRDNPDPNKRNGVMNLDSTRCKGGSEITTYDSLDTSLGQARKNTYLAVKILAAYWCLAKVFKQMGKNELAQIADQQSDRCMATLTQSVLPDGTLPAVIDENLRSKIIPVIEGLAFAWFAGCQEQLDLQGKNGAFLQILKNHLQKIMVKGICLFEDGGWKMSSTSENSWLSKIYLCQFVARHILRFDNPELYLLADKAHVKWLLDEKLSYWCWSDQILAGKILAAKFYPRGVTSILWLYEKGFFDKEDNCSNPTN